MAIIWDQSLKPWIDTNGDPVSGVKAYFFDANTTTPLTVYEEGTLSQTHDHPVVADAAGQFPAVFLPEAITYRVRITTAAGVTLHDVDNISVPTTVVPEPPEGDTPIEFLNQTGFVQMMWRSSAPNGWVRMNGRTIGSGASSATERANNDCEALFLFLWNQDVNLAVSGGRGGSAAGDWAAAKTIALPSIRGKTPVGPDSFGNSAANAITDAQLGADSDLLGATGGSASHTLTSGEMPGHTHTGTTDSNGAHTHTVGTQASSISGGATIFRGNDVSSQTIETSSNGAHTHTFTTGSTGGGGAHNNLQPSLVVPFFIKL